jgi:predicted membrane metal-binding protein
MLTGDVDDRLLNLEFNRLGLQHILGVSGFQFVLLAALVGFLFRLILPYKIATCGLILSLTAYFFFLATLPCAESLASSNHLFNRNTPQQTYNAY